MCCKPELRALPFSSSSMTDDSTISAMTIISSEKIIRLMHHLSFIHRIRSICSCILQLFPILFLVDLRRACYNLRSPQVEEIGRVCQLLMMSVMLTLPVHLLQC